MRIPSHHFESSGRHDATMTPMIDVVFLLLIFFICTASFQIIEQNLPSQIQIEAPGGASDASIEPAEQDLEPVIVTIGWRNGRPIWTISGEPCADWEVLKERLAAAAAIDTGVPVILDPVAEVPLGYVIESYDLSRSTGFSQIQFAARSSG